MVAAGSGSTARASRPGFDLILVGGGLQNGLIALAALHARPSRRIALIEAEGTLGGNHTWSLHAGDVPDQARAFIEPLLVSRFDRHEVRFPGLTRLVHTPYAVISSERFDHVVQRALAEAPGCELRLGRRAVRIGARQVELDDGSVLSGEIVIDARGPQPDGLSGTGYQKFLGRELQTREPHGLKHPILIDATVAQRDGFRFFYVLPLAPDRVLVEDTCFSRTPALDLAAARPAIDVYARRFGPIRECVREECGVLPMPWGHAPELKGESPLVAGYRGGYFHPATGYSLPVALRLALHVASHDARDMFSADFARMVSRHKSQARYARELNRLLFHCFADSEMWNVFARFYTLPEPVLGRFYALDLTRWDRARILVGRPPRGFSLSHALSLSRSP